MVKAIRRKPGPQKEFVRPEIKHHAARNEACIFHENGRIYLGKWDGESAIPTEVYQTWLQTCSFLEERYHAKKAGVPAPEEDSDIVIDQALAMWFGWLKLTPVSKGCLRKSGDLTDFFYSAPKHLFPLRAMYGNTNIVDFDGECLEALQTRMLAGTWWHPQNTGGAKRQPKPWSPSMVNKATSTIIRFFRYLELKRHVPLGTIQNLKSAGRFEEEGSSREPVSPEVVDATLPYLTPPVRALIELQLLTGARPSELAKIRPADLDRSDPSCWKYAIKKHKTSYRKKVRTLFFYAPAQMVLRSYLNRDPEEFCFKPIEGWRWGQRQQAKTDRPARKTPIYPSELERRKRLKQERKARPKKRQFQALYDYHVLTVAVGRAVVRANRDGLDLPHWTPYQVRHTVATLTRLEHGAQASAAMMGHSVKVNDLYDHDQETLARMTAGKIQTGLKVHRPEAG